MRHLTQTALEKTDFKERYRRIRILDANLSWAGYSVLQAMEKAGMGVAREVQKALKRSKSKARIAVFCGPGNKGGDGFVAARHLAQAGYHVTVFCVAKPKTDQARQNLDRLKKTKNVKINNLNPATFPKTKFDVLIDGLLGTGISGSLRPPYDAIVPWLNSQTGFKVAIDVPTGWNGRRSPAAVYFRDDRTVSMHVSKKPGAVVVDVGIPDALESLIGPGHVKALRLNAGSHKGQNGVLTVIGGSKKYHGAQLYAIEAAAPFVDLTYFFSPEKDNLRILKMKSKSNAFITLESQKGLDAAVEKSDAVLAGNGLEENAANKALVNRLLRKFPQKKFVLDAGAMKLADKRLFFGRVVLTPHAGEFQRCFGLNATAQNARKMAALHHAIILLKGPIDVVTDGRSEWQNATGNAGMTRGGTGDVLAGVVAALATQNDLFLAAQAGAFLNGLAGDIVAKRQRAFTADDVAKALPDALETAFVT